MNSLPAPYHPAIFEGTPQAFIALESVSGVGKSTLVPLLERIFRATSLHTLPRPHNDWSTSVNSQLAPLPQFCFYLSGLLHAADQVRTARQVSTVIADRYQSSVIACHAADDPSAVCIDTEGKHPSSSPTRSGTPWSASVLNPINTAAVLREGTGKASGRHPDEIHAGVAWWLGACLVVTQQAAEIAVAHDGNPVSTEYAIRLARGATNAQHYKCHVTGFVAPTTRSELLRRAVVLGGVPSVHITVTPEDVVTLALFDTEGKPLSEEAGMARIRTMIEQDRVPIPVNDSSRGTIEDVGEVTT